MSTMTTINHKCDLCGKVCNPIRKITHTINWGYMNENPLIMELPINMNYGCKDVCKKCLLENLKRIVKDMERESK